MNIGLGQTVTAAVGRLRELQQLSRTATNQAIGHYLHGCADLVMARTPHEALTALYKTQLALLRHSTDTFTEATRLGRE